MLREKSIQAPFSCVELVGGRLIQYWADLEHAYCAVTDGAAGNITFCFFLNYVVT